MSLRSLRDVQNADPPAPRGVAVVYAMLGAQGKTWCCPRCKSRDQRSRFRDHGKHATLRRHRLGIG